MASWGTLKPVLVPVSVITVVALVAVMGATGRVSQCVIKKSKAKRKGKGAGDMKDLFQTSMFAGVTLSLLAYLAGLLLKKSLSLESSIHCSSR